MILFLFGACLALVRCTDLTTAGSVLLNSNAIKLGPAVAVSASPVQVLFDSGNQNFAIDTVQPFLCVADEDCGDEEFCFLSRGACLQCKKRRKRCIRDAMCCPGNHCSNGVCQPDDFVLQAGAEGHALVSTPHNNTTTVVPQLEATQNIKGLEGENCLRSSDCSEGLCCARHFWSKICKPVLKEGQVCTKHKRKGTHALELFQRCDCGEGMSCKVQRGDDSKSSRSLHTCQRH
ncbi:dickkopf-related protein 1b [Electrophorus electricus]|uniref:Dickkopf N-terminal cysteine-rich domain-containing protein n=1 Tax=Electrophorus electricus TaxID=8005 RepID=A0A4W4E0Y2_ELEEL|nr:dickkopf-related protein 1b [Electrophorus electricus]